MGGFLDAREHLMSEGMVKEMMQKDKEKHREWKRFNDVDKWWEHIMQIFRATPHWMALLDVHKMLESTREAANVTERILNAIHDVLHQRKKQMGFCDIDGTSHANEETDCAPDGLVTSP